MGPGKKVGQSAGPEEGGGGGGGRQNVRKRHGTSRRETCTAISSHLLHMELVPDTRESLATFLAKVSTGPESASPGRWGGEGGRTGRGVGGTITRVFLTQKARKPTPKHRRGSRARPVIDDVPDPGAALPA